MSLKEKHPPPAFHVLKGRAYPPIIKLPLVPAPLILQSQHKPPYSASAGKMPPAQEQSDKFLSFRCTDRPLRRRAAWPMVAVL